MQNKMSDSQFKPDYKLWWKKKSITKEDFAWVILGINPESARKAETLRTVTKVLNSEEVNFLYQFEEFESKLSNGNPLKAKNLYKELLKIDWGKGKEDFVRNAYESACEIPNDFCIYLQSIGKMPNSPDLERYKDHEQYKADISKWKSEDIDSEDKALSLLLGLNPEFWPNFVSLYNRQVKGQRTPDGRMPFYTFTSGEKWFFCQYHNFLREEFLDIGQGILQTIADFLVPRYENAKRLLLWKDSLQNYVQELHDAGYIFSQEVYASLQNYGVRLNYSSEGWAVKFCKEWIERGVWSLEEAAELYLGIHPYGERGFIYYGKATIYKGPGRVLFKSLGKIMIGNFNESGEWISPPLKHLEDDISLEVFVQRHISNETLRPASTNGLKDGLYFQPKEIVKFFRDYFPGTSKPQLLFTLLGIQTSNRAISVETTIDAFEEVYWNLAQLYAWVYTRDKELVQKARSENSDFGSFYQELTLPDGHKRMVETSSGPVTILKIGLTSAYDQSLNKKQGYFSTTKEAEDEIKIHLQSGKLKSWGIRNNQGELVEIPTYAWADITHFSEDLSHVCNEGNTVKWYRVKFLKKNILKLWPFNTDLIEKQKKLSIQNTSLEKAYKKHIADCEEKGRIPSWEEDQKAMEVALGRKPTNGLIKKIRREKAPKHWKQKGRRRSGLKIAQKEIARKSVTIN